MMLTLNCPKCSRGLGSQHDTVPSLDSILFVQSTASVYNSEYSEPEQMGVLVSKFIS